MKSTYLSTALVFLFSTALSLQAAPQTAKEAWEGLLPGRAAKTPVFSHVTPRAGKPKVLIYGDSISIGYTPEVRKQLKNEADVFRIYRNGADSSAFIPTMKTMAKSMRNPDLKDPWDFKWDVIHVNVGLHDLKKLKGKKLSNDGKTVNKPDQYRKNLEDIFNYLKKSHPDAKLIFALTTRVPEGAEGRSAGDAAVYNEVAKKLIASKFPDIMINDLYTPSVRNSDAWMLRKANVHFTPEGSRALGKQVAEKISAALKKKP